MTQPDDRPVRLILDASAVSAFSRGSIHVGEVLAEIDAENGSALIPLACLVEAARGHGPAGEEDARLDVLVAHPTVEILADDPSLWRALAATCDLVGSPDAASAALAALDYDVGLLTRHPGRYAGLGGGGLALPLDE